MASLTKTVLITGATGGIGLAVCRRLAKAGHAIVLAARGEAKLKALCDDLRKASPAEHSWISVDMTKDAAIEGFGNELRARNVILDGAVLMPPQLPRSNDPLPSSDILREAFQNSFIGPLALLKTAISLMDPDPAAGRRCKVAIISAISSAQILGHYAVSNAVRTAWVAEAKTLAFALGGRGIYINTLSLGGILTPGYTELIRQRAAAAGISFEQRLAEETSNVPLGKYGAPDEVAAAVDGLLSEFSDHMTGLNIMCDGGFTRAY